MNLRGNRAFSEDQRFPAALVAKAQVLLMEPVMQWNLGRLALYAAVISMTVPVPFAWADDSGDTQKELKLLKEENRALQQRVQKQEAIIESLGHAVKEIQKNQASLGGSADRSTTLTTELVGEPRSTTFSLGKVNISGEGGVGFFESGREGAFPNNEFRVDEAKLFIEAPIMEGVYFFAELNLATREAPDLSLQLGELYLDFENVSRVWGAGHWLSVRAGRLDIPFGEEYMNRDAIDNPLISHSLTDFWGVDEGVELYGKAGKASYVLAVQNGGNSDVRDFDGDKSVAGRISYDPANWIHLSASGMRTGNLRQPGDAWSALWFSSGWIVPLTDKAMQFHAELVEGDVQIRLPGVQVKMFGGALRYDDNDSTAKNRRDIYFYSLEATHSFTKKFYAGARFGQIFAPKGYPIVGNGNTDYFYDTLTEELWRLSMGVGYRFSDNLILKAEYTLERGKELGGDRRNHEDMGALEAVFKF